MAKVIQVMFVWVVAFMLVGQWLVPSSLQLLGLTRADLSTRGTAALHLLIDICEMLLTLLILNRFLAPFRPHGLFPLSWRGPWWRHVAIGCLCFPLVDWAAHQSQLWFPCRGEKWAAAFEQSLSSGDSTANALYFCVVSLCAPVWEEVIFRGFLLPSLGRYMTPANAVMASAVVFSMAHCSLQRFLPLVLLGCIMGFVFLSCRNLVAPIVLHSLWNLYIFAQLVFKPMPLL